MLTSTDPVAPRSAFSIHKRLKSFGFAFAGLRHLVATEHNAWLHGLATFGALATGLVVAERDDWLWIVLAIGWVWSAEAFNTAIERLADRVTEERDPQIAIVKDLAAAGVLVSAFGAAVIGLLIFVPRFALLP